MDKPTKITNFGILIFGCVSLLVSLASLCFLGYFAVKHMDGVKISEGAVLITLLIAGLSAYIGGVSLGESTRIIPPKKEKETK